MIFPLFKFVYTLQKLKKYNTFQYLALIYLIFMLNYN